MLCIYLLDPAGHFQEVLDRVSLFGDFNYNIKENLCQSHDMDM